MKRARRKPATTQELGEILDRFEQMLVEGRGDQAEALMQRLWDGRQKTAKLLAERLADGRSRIPFVAFRLLAGLAGSRTRSYLRQVAESPSAPDIVRFGARRRMGWSRRGEAKARLAFLDTLRNGSETLLEALHQASTAFPHPPDVEVLSEVLGYLLAMPPAEAVELTTTAAEELGRDAAWLFRALLHSKPRAMRLAALKEIVAVGDAGASAAMSRAARISGNPQFARDVEAAERRLQMKVVGNGEKAAGTPMPPLHAAYLSSVDGDGGQVAIVVRQRAEEVYLVAQLFFKDGWGIRDSFGMNALTWEELASLYETDEDRRLTGLAMAPGEDVEGAPAIPLVEVDPAAVRSALTHAAEINVATGHGLPPAFELLEPLVHSEDPPPDDEATIVPELDDEPYRDGDEPYRKSADLLDLPYFQGWFFNPEEIEPLLYGVPRPTNRVLTDRQFRPLITELVDEPMQQLLRRRLRRQAWLLERVGDNSHRDIALAAASRLPAGENGLVRHPLLRGMILSSLENAFGVPFTSSSPR